MVYNNGYSNVRRRKRVMYPCIPTYAKFEAKDPFDYPLQSKEHVVKQDTYFPPKFDMQVTMNRYVAGDVTPLDTNYDTRGRVAKITLDIRDLQLAPLQRKRFQYLMGPRWNPRRPHHLKIVYGLYNDYKENYVRCFETLREIYWEAKRAPDC